MRLYFAGIGGVGLGPLAQICQDAGYEVVGSDPSDSLMSRELVDRGVLVSPDQSGGFLVDQHEHEPIDWFVYTSALPDDHAELQTARELGLRISKRDELLARIITEKNLKLIAVAGTHGKTTTTGMLVWAMKQLGLPVSYSIGTTLSWGPSGAFDPESEYFVYECDEFDRNFLHFSPYISLITSIEHDHPDTYPTAGEYFDAFSEFASKSKLTIGWKQDLEKLTSDSESWQLAPDEVKTIQLAGAHNRQNATLVAKLVERIHGKDEVTEAIESFPGTARRFEKLADNLYSDYGHTPTEIAATLQMAREMSDKVVLVYQPHQNARQHEIRDQYNDQIFKDAHTVYWLPTYLSREHEGQVVLSPAELTTRLDSTRVEIAEMNDELWSHIRISQKSGALVLCMGAGSIDEWVRSKLV